MSRLLSQAKCAATAAGFDIETGALSQLDHPSCGAFRRIKQRNSDHLVLDLSFVDDVENPAWSSRIQAILEDKRISVISREIANQRRASLQRWINRSDSPISSEEALRLSRGNSTDMSPEAINRRMNKVAQLYRFWKATRAARMAAGKPGPYDLPPENLKPISLKPN